MLCLIVVCVVVAVADGVIEEEPADKFADQYREPEPEGQCHDFRKALQMASSISSFDAYFDPVL